MVITRLLNFRGSKGRDDLQALFDSGASVSCIDPAVAEKLEIVTPLPDPFNVETAAKGHFIKVDQRVTLDFHLNDLRLSDEFILIPGLAEDVIIGASTMQKWKIKLDFEHDAVVTDPRVSRMILM